jgi:hypothetical protein
VRPDGRGEWVALLGGIVVAVAVLTLIGWNVVRLAEGKTTVEALKGPEAYLPGIHENGEIDFEW